MSGVLLRPLPRWFTAAGKPVSNGRVYTYRSATTTPAPAYGDHGLTTPLSNPVELDASGSVAIFLDPDVTYRIEVQDRDGRVVSQVDGVHGVVRARSTTPSAPTPPGAPVGCPSMGEHRWVWNRPASGGQDITAYAIQLREKGQASWGASISVAGTSYRQTSTDDTKVYEARVAAVNPVGTSQWSATGESPSAGPPWRIQQFVVSPADDAIECRWSAPYANGAAITGYQVQWKSGTQDWDSTRQAAAAGTSYTISSLVAGVRYDVRVRAINSEGNADWSVVLYEEPD